MNIIICGTGQVGLSIAEHLAVNNNVTIIDSNVDRVQRAADTMNLRGVIGVSSHPDILAEAGAKDADMLIAVTDSDELNMVSCQVAHTIYNTPIKISRIRASSYLDPSFGDLYGADNLPIDHIISPEREVSDAVSNRLHVPGAFDVARMGDDMVRIIGVRCGVDCPVLGTQIRYLTQLFSGLSIRIIAILRGNETIVLRDAQMKLLEGDQVYFICKDDHLSRAMAAFGHEEPASRKVVIAGGGAIGISVAQELHAHTDDALSVMIEKNVEIAEHVAEILQDTTILAGDALEPDILTESDVEKADTFIALTADDEVNVLSALLARRYGAAHTVVLVNMASFVPLISNLGVDSVINPPAITVASILRYVRRGRVRDIHTIVEGKGEFIEFEAQKSSPLVEIPLRALKLPKTSIVCAIIRNGEMITPEGDTVILVDDRVIIFALRECVGVIEKMLAVRPDFF